MTKTDGRLKEDIEEELQWDPKVNAAQIGVSVDNGAVSLLGSVDNYAEKWAAQGATKRVSGVRAIVQNLEVKILSAHTRNDSDITGAIVQALEWDVVVPDVVTGNVEEGWVTLEGHVDWHFQREAAERAVRHLKGVVGVHNFVSVHPPILAV